MFGLLGRRVLCESVAEERRSERASSTRLETSLRDETRLVVVVVVVVVVI